MLGAGDSFGELAVIDKGPRSASVVATSDVTAQSIASITLRPMLKEHPELADKLLLQVCAMVRRAETRLT